MCLTSDSTLKIKKEVKFNEAANSFHNVVAYSKIYGWLPSMKVATSKGWKDVSARACHFTGKSAEVLKARLARRGKTHNQHDIDVYRRTMLRIVNAGDERTLVAPSSVNSLIASLYDEPSHG